MAAPIILHLSLNSVPAEPPSDGAPRASAPNVSEFGGPCEALFELHRPWAESIGRSARQALPPSFELQDLQQVALIEHWRRVKLYDASRGVPYRAYAYAAIRGAVMMSCRRREYRENTHEPLLPFGDAYLDGRPNPEEAVLRREKRRNVAGPREYRQRARLRIAFALLPAEDSDLVRQVLAGADVGELERSAPGTRTRLSRAVHRLKRELTRPRRPDGFSTPDVVPRTTPGGTIPDGGPQPQRMTDTPQCEPAAQLPPEELRAAIARLAPADAYLIRRVHLDGVNVEDLSAVWGVDVGERLRSAMGRLTLVAAGTSGEGLNARSASAMLSACPG